MFGSNVIVAQVAGLVHRVLDHLLGTGRQRQSAQGHFIGTRLQELFHFKAYSSEIDVEILQHVGGYSAPLLYQSEQDMLGADVFVVEPLCFLIGKLHDFSGAISKTFMHRYNPSTTRRDTPRKPPPTTAAKHRGDAPPRFPSTSHRDFRLERWT